MQGAPGHLHLGVFCIQGVQKLTTIASQGHLVAWQHGSTAVQTVLDVQQTGGPRAAIVEPKRSVQCRIPGDMDGLVTTLLY